MNPSDLYSMTLSALTAARAQMLTPDFQASEQLEDAGVRLQASQTLIDIQQAVLALSTANLRDIADAMQANETGLIKATSGLTKALQKITDVQNIVDKAATLLKIAAKIVPFL